MFLLDFESDTIDPLNASDSVNTLGIVADFPLFYVALANIGIQKMETIDAMKILHIGKYFHPFTGGIEHYMAGLMEEQIHQGHQVKAIVHHHEAGKSCNRLNYKGVDVYKLNTFGGIPFVPLSWRVPGVLSQLLGDFQPDVIHLHVPNVAAFWGLFKSDARKIPWVVHWHSDVLDYSSPRFIKMLYPV